MAQTDDRVAQADRLLIGAGVDADPDAALALYQTAAEAGAAAAAGRLAVLSAIGFGKPADFSEALDLLLQAAELGDASARRQLAVLADKPSISPETASQATWRRLRDGLSVSQLLTVPPVSWRSQQPAIGIVQGLATPAIANWLIRRAQKLLEPGKVHDIMSGEIRTDANRTAAAAPFTILQRDVVTVLMQERVARVVSVPLHCHEPPNVIGYLPGQEFKEHHDFLDPAVPHFAAELDILGQRVFTCLTYLNDDYAAGETYFTALGWKYRGAVGDALIFRNVAADGRPDALTLHAGLPPTRGRKWLLSQWIRNKVQLLN